MFINKLFLGRLLSKVGEGTEKEMLAVYFREVQGNNLKTMSLTNAIQES